MRMVTLLAAAAALAGCGDGGATGETEGPQGPVAAAPSPDSPGPAQTAPAMRTEVREFRDWRAVCDNGNACVAWTGSDTAGWLRVAMEPGPDAVPRVDAGSWAFGGPDQNADTLRLRIDGRDQSLRAGPRDAANAEAGAARGRALVAGIVAARSLGLSSNGQAGALPASGASAALLWIDERQGRLDTTTALVRRGDRAASTVPAPPPLPVVRQAPAVAQTGFEGAANPMADEPPGLRVPAAIEARAEVKACRAENNEYLNKAVLAARLDASTVLWGVPCGSGAYNATYVLYLADATGGNVRPAALPTREPRKANAEGDLWLVNPVYDPPTQTLTVFPRGRGLGDCGTIQTWTWTGRAGFALKQERFMGDCHGMTPDYWPTTWRTRG